MVRGLTNFLRDHTLDVKLNAEEQLLLQAEADKRGVTLEEYLRWRLLTAAGVVRGGAVAPRHEAVRRSLSLFQGQSACRNATRSSFSCSENPIAKR